MGIRIAQGACLGKPMRPKQAQCRVWTRWGWGDNDDYSTDVNDNPRKRGRRVAQDALH